MSGKFRIETDRARLARILRRLRTEAKMPQGDLAQRLGRPQSFVSRYETGQRRLDLPELKEVCQELGITLRMLVEHFEDRHEA